MAKRLFFETKMYDYTTKTQAEADIPKMREKGWRVKEQYEQSDWSYGWTVVYMRGVGV